MEAFAQLKNPSVYIKFLQAANLGDSNKLYYFQMTYNSLMLKTQIREGSDQYLEESIELSLENVEQVVIITCYSVPEAIENEEEQLNNSSLENSFQPSIEQQNLEMKIQKNENEKKIQHQISFSLAQLKELKRQLVEV